MDDDLKNWKILGDGEMKEMESPL